MPVLCSFTGDFRISFCQKDAGGQQMEKPEWYSKSWQETVTFLTTDIRTGLNLDEVEARQKQSPNRIIEKNRKHPAAILLKQFTDTMMLVLLGATVISGIVGAMADALTIMAIVVINCILGFIQEYKAEKSLEALKKLATSYSRVIRAGKITKIPSYELVPGDVVMLEAGDKVPADIRLIEAFALETDESALTGESVPVEKNAVVILEAATILAEQVNMVFMGTTVTRGRCRGVVTNTGMNTVMGEIAQLMKESADVMTPLQERLSHLGKVLIAICLGVCAMVAILGVYRGEKIITMVLAGVSLAVAAIPEGLPAVVTVVLALGVQRMARRSAIIRKLPAVETLGCTTVVCSDKTGTLTQNQMTVKKIATAQEFYKVSGEGYKPEGHFLDVRGKMIDPDQYPILKQILDICLNCNNSAIESSGGEHIAQGDPTEAALLVLALKGQISEKGSLIREIPFDSERKMMSTLVEYNGNYILMVKGAVEKVIFLSSALQMNNKQVPLDPKRQEYFLTLQDQWAQEALRVLGFAYRIIDSKDVHKLGDEELECNLTFLGLCGIMDPPRPEVKRSVSECLSAGIVPVMITGDYPATAGVIAAELGISTTGAVIKGSDIDSMSDDKLYQHAMHDRVFARVTPQHKNRIVKVLQAKQQVVAMTGDGINDAPAVKTADIGIAMGITGTEVTREASAMVLSDDNFATIIYAVYEGRAIYDNIRKFIRYLLGGNIGEVLVMLLASVFGMPLPLLPIQILWINLVTDGFPALALGIEPPEPGVMQRKPRARSESLFARRLGWIIFSRGVFIAVVTLAAFTMGVVLNRMSGSENLMLARTMAFTTLVFAQLFYVFECRSERFSPFELGFFKNPYLVIAVSVSIAMELAVLYIPALQSVFKTVGLNSWQWMVIIVLSGFKLWWKLILYILNRIFVWRPNYVKINV
jgi:Ca2+-transporting ATPase